MVCMCVYMCVCFMSFLRPLMFPLRGGRIQALNAKNDKKVFLFHLKSSRCS